MPIIVTRGLGSFGDGTTSALLSTEGYGSPGSAAYLACKAFTALGLDVFPTYLDVVCNNLPSISGPTADPSQWVVENLGTGANVSVTAVSVTTNRIRLQVTEQTNGNAYRLLVPVPPLGLVDQFGNGFDGPFSFTFTGAGIVPTALLARSVDARTVEVAFDVPVNDADASNAANYSVSPTLAITASVRVSATVYRLTTSKQTIGQVYTVTVSGIRDIDGNMI